MKTDGAWPSATSRPTLAAMREAGVDGRRLASELLAGKLPLGFAFSDA